MKYRTTAPRRGEKSRAEKPSPEFALIDRLCARLPLSKRTILGPGDDTAILSPSRRAQLMTIDSMVEGVHFNMRWGTPEQLGARAVTVNLSDVAAMGGTPTACVVNLAVRRGLPVRFFDRLYAGLVQEARVAHLDVVGGNIARAQQLAITIALIGDAPAAPLRRDAARAGDEIFVTGTVGDAAVGWRVLAGKLRSHGAARRYLIGRYLAPIARLGAGARLARIRPAPAAIDISDGLWQDLGHILERSKVGAEIDPRAIPVSDAYRSLMGGDLALALGGGEDYELLFCVRPGFTEDRLSTMLGVRATRIGLITARRGARLQGGTQPTRGGYDQLRADDS